MRKGIVVAAFAAAVLAAGAASAKTDENFGATLPPGPELTTLKASCQICHTFDMVTSQRLSPQIWDAEVNKMVGWGSPVPAAQKAAVIAYLAKYLAPSVPRNLVHPQVEAPPITYESPEK